MSKKTYEKSTPKKILSFIIDVLIAITLLCAVIGTTAGTYWMKPDTYKRAVLTDEFDASVEKQIEKSLDGIGSIVEIPTETVINAAGTDKLIRYEHEYINVIFTALFTEEKLLTEPFESDALHSAVMQTLDEYAAQADVSVEDAEGVYTYINRTLNNTLRFLPEVAVKAINKASEYIAKLNGIRAAVIPLWAAAAILITLGIAINGKKRISDSLFGILSATWTAFVTVFIPLVMLAIYDIPSHIALVKTPIYYLVSGTVKVLITDSALIFGAVTVALTVALAAVIVVRLLKKRDKEHRTRGFYRADFNETDESEDF